MELYLLTQQVTNKTAHCVPQSQPMSTA
jgi:hypothetical protein